MNESRYLQVFSDASDAMLHFIGMDEEYRSQDFSFYTVETHIRHLNEVGGSEPLIVETQLLGFDEKRIRINHVMIHPPSGKMLATGEHMFLHVNTEKGRAVQMGQAIFEKLEKDIILIKTSSGNIKTYVYSFDEKSIIKDLDWALQYWNKEREAIPTTDSKKCTNCRFNGKDCLLYTSPSPRDRQKSRMPSSA